MAAIAVESSTIEKFCALDHTGFSSDKPPLQNPTRTHGLHRFTMFIGYGEDAGKIFKQAEQLKYKMGFSTNMQFLSHLMNHINNCVMEKSREQEESSAIDSESNTIEYIYDANKKILTEVHTDITNEDQALFSNSVSHVIHLSNNCEAPHPLVQRKNLFESKDDDDLCNMNLTSQSKLITDFDRDLVRKNHQRNTSLGKRKCDVLEDTMIESYGESFCKQMDVEQRGICENQYLNDLVDKVLRLVHEHLDELKLDMDYCSGYIASFEKLKIFLGKFHAITNISFKVRSSRSYTKNQTLGNLLESKGKEMETLNAMTMHASSTNGVAAKTTYTRKAIDHLPINEKDPGKDKTVPGPFYWEFTLGKPSIPFTGVPFYIFGNTLYQCVYANADVRTQRRKEKNEQIKRGNPEAKLRSRQSTKRNCKAIMCVKSIVTFPEFSICDKLNDISSKKGRRKLKASTLESLRETLDRDNSLGRPSFWVYLPLPQAHSTHGFSEKMNMGHMS